MKQYIAIVLISLVGCTYTGVTSRGWQWTSPSSSTSSKDIETVVRVTKETFERETGKKIPRSAYKKIDRIRFTYYHTYCMPDEPGGSGECLGQVDYEDKEMWITTRGSCLARTSLPHELIHIFAKSTGLSDPFHDNPLLFEKAVGPNKETVEHKAEEQAFKALGCTELVLF